MTFIYTSNVHLSAAVFFRSVITLNTISIKNIKHNIPDFPGTVDETKFMIVDL